MQMVLKIWENAAMVKLDICPKDGSVWLQDEAGPEQGAAMQQAGLCAKQQVGQGIHSRANQVTIFGVMIKNKSLFNFPLTFLVLVKFLGSYHLRSLT